MDSRSFIYTSLYHTITYVYVYAHFNAIAAVAFLPLLRSPSESMRELWSPPLLSHS